MGGPGVFPPVPAEAVQGTQGWKASADPRDHVFDIGRRELVATVAKKLDDVAPSQCRVNVFRDEPPGCGYGALSTKMRSEYFIEFAGHGARPASAVRCPARTSATTAAEKRSARSRLRLT